MIDMYLWGTRDKLRVIFSIVPSRIKLEKDYIFIGASRKNVDFGVVQESQDTNLPALE